MKVISLGWGVQSFALAAMSALGDLPPIYAAIHADTIHECSATYEFAARWTPWLEAHGVKIVTVINPTGGIWPLMTRLKQTHIPAFTRRDGFSDGQLNRSCTHRWKIVPMRRWIQEHRNGQPIEQWIGISTDEFYRAKDSDVKYITLRYPLIELGMTRHDCERYLADHGLEIPSKSSCTFCPFHDQRAWHDMKMENNRDWDAAVKVDLALRKLRPPYELFIHPARVPLSEVDLRTQEERGQLTFWQQTCESGYCWT